MIRGGVRSRKLRVKVATGVGHVPEKENQTRNQGLMMGNVKTVEKGSNEAVEKNFKRKRGKRVWKISLGTKKKEAEADRS